MSPKRLSIIEALHALFVALWLAALIGSALGASIVFPVMKDLNPSLPQYGAYHGEHWKIAAGHVGNKLFGIADMIQLVGAVGAVGTLGLALHARSKAGQHAGGLWAFRAGVVGAAAALAAYHILILGPSMTQGIQDFWAAARAGDASKADTLQAAFNKNHPVSRLILEATTVLMLLALVAGVYHAGRGEAPKARA